MASIAISTVVKKAAEALLNSKKGRKFLLYTVGIVLVIVLLPLIALVGLFGFFSGSEFPLDQKQIMENLSAEDQAIIAGIDKYCEDIRTTFVKRGLTESDAEKAVAIYLACLIGMEGDTLTINLAKCFEDASDTASVYDNVAAVFSVSFTEEEKEWMDKQYGVTGVTHPVVPDWQEGTPVLSFQEGRG